MKKNEFIQAKLSAWDSSPDSHLPREYRAYFDCFNQRLYYEAHDVLEHLWLDCQNENRSFFQGLIQIVGAFVHFQKQASAPTHPTHSRRLAPGGRLLALARNRLAPYAHPKTPLHMQLDVHSLVEQCRVWELQASQQNPLLASPSPHLRLSCQSSPPKNTSETPPLPASTAPNAFDP